MFCFLWIDFVGDGTLATVVVDVAKVSGSSGERIQDFPLEGNVESKGLMVKNDPFSPLVLNLLLQNMWLKHNFWGWY